MTYQKKSSLILVVLIGFLSRAQQIENSLYQAVLNNDGSVTLQMKGISKPCLVEAKFHIMYCEADPKTDNVNAHRLIKGFKGVVTIPTWNEEGSNERTADFFKAAKSIIVTASSGRLQDKQVVWTFPVSSNYTLQASFSLPEGAGEPSVTYTFSPKKAAWYSVGFAGMPQLDASDADAIWQPFIWQEKRFPQQSFLSAEDMCSLPSVMVENDGVTLGVVAEPTHFPYELPSASQGNLKFGVLVRNPVGKAQPMIFAPLFGTKASKLPVNKPFTFSFRILMFKGTQPDAFRHVAKNMFGFKDYRKNVFFNLNQTIENTIDFAMNDVYSGWNADLRGFDYSTDVAQTVKVVSGLHPLSTALITDNESIYKKRALPMIEFLMSRERYLFTINKNVTRQNASSKMNGPAMEVSELTALQSFYGNRSPVFKYYADSLSLVSRSLNLSTINKGDSWPNLLALYRMTGDDKFLTRCKNGADEYIRNRITNKQTDFSAIEQAAQFWTDFAPWWIELLDLYEETKEKQYLDAAVEGAKLYMQYVWFYPTIPDKNIIINKDGVVKYRSYEAIRDSMPFMSAPEQSVPAWRVSQIGLTPEASNTYGSNPAIFLTHFAAHLLRLAYYTKDDFFRSVARSAVVGRYSNYPGYDINGIFNTVYSRADYPLRAYNQISYNQVYYNHVWPQIALLLDYLISDAFVLSDGNITFPNQFAAGYAYLKSNVYGDRPGSFYGDSSVYLWMPKQILTTDNEQLNYITGYGNGKFYVAFVNQSDKPVTGKITLNPDLVPYKALHNMRIWNQNTLAKPGSIADGKFTVSVGAKGIAAFAIDDINIVTQFQKQAYDKTENKLSDNSYKKISSPFGKISAAIFSMGELNSSYTWLESSNEQLTKATINYRKKGSVNCLKMEDHSFPFEFTIPLQPNDQELELWIEGATPKGDLLTSDKILLKK